MDGLWGLRRTTVGRTAAMETQAEAILTFGCNDVRRSGRTLRTVAHVPRFCAGVLWIYRDLISVWGTRLFVTQESGNEPDLSRSRIFSANQSAIWEKKSFRNRQSASASRTMTRIGKLASQSLQVWCRAGRAGWGGFVHFQAERRTRREGSGAPAHDGGSVARVSRARDPAQTRVRRSRLRGVRSRAPVVAAPRRGRGRRGDPVVRCGRRARAECRGRVRRVPPGGTRELRRRRRRRRSDAARPIRRSTTTTTTTTSTTTACPRCSPAVPRATLPRPRTGSPSSGSSTAGTSTRISRGWRTASSRRDAHSAPERFPLSSVSLQPGRVPPAATSSTAPGSTSTRTGSTRGT